MRFFLALEIPESSREEILLTQQKIKQFIPTIRLTDSQKLHLTIAFIGDQDESLRTQLTEVMKQAAQGIPPFEVTPAYFDGFPNLHQSRILWMGVKGDIDKLMILRERIKDCLVNLNLEVDERRYTPHITIGKLTDFHLTGTQEQQLEILTSLNFAPITINSIKLFESIPQEGFHQHNTLAQVNLIPEDLQTH